LTDMRIDVALTATSMISRLDRVGSRPA
jgi:hypothetical protein